MNFFQNQDAARRKTSLLVWYFFIAVVLIVLAVYLAAAAIYLAFQTKTGRPGAPIGTLWNPQLFLAVAGGTLLLIFFGSLYKINELRSGGEAVARILGGRPVAPNTTDLDERVLLNVVEEMAIASGTPVPPVFVLDNEQGINAFAAGFSPQDAVVTVTRGALETLSREELQGVVGHEFSHILNGDMRLDIRLMGLLNGILLIALLGYGILRTLGAGRVSTSSDDDKKGGGAIIVAILALGVALIVIGFIGVVFGRLIKSAVSRQREFLADASSVQFTRNPGGIAGALKKIGGLAKGSRVDDADAESASHMFFANALAESAFGLLATHPPLVERIKRIDPTFDGTFPEVTRVARTARDLARADLAASEAKHAAAIHARSAIGGAGSAAAAAAFAFQPAAAVSSVGSPAPQHAAYARAAVAAVPAKLREVVRDPLGAVATIYCLLLNDDEAARGIQVKYLVDHAGLAYQEAQQILPLVQAIGPELRLPLVAMTLPALCHLSQRQYSDFRDTVRQLVEADQTISLFEYALQHLLLRHLAARFEKVAPATIRYDSLEPLVPSCVGLLSTLAHVGQGDEAAAARAFAAGVEKLGVPDAKMLAVDESGFQVVDEALAQLAQAAPQIKQRALEAFAACVGADGQVTVDEAELLRVIADSLDCPMPPILAGATVGGA